MSGGRPKRPVRKESRDVERRVANSFRAERRGIYRPEGGGLPRPIRIEFGAGRRQTYGNALVYQTVASARAEVIIWLIRERTRTVGVLRPIFVL